MLVTACITICDSRMTWPYSVDGTLQLLTRTLLGVLLQKLTEKLVDVQVVTRFFHCVLPIESSKKNCKNSEKPVFLREYQFYKFLQKGKLKYIYKRLTFDDVT
jgi:hypothetical protein